MGCVSEVKSPSEMSNEIVFLFCGGFCFFKKGFEQAYIMTDRTCRESRVARKRGKGRE